MIERHVTFHLRPGQTQAFEAFFSSSYGPALARQAGFSGAGLLLPQDAVDTLLMVLRFTDADAARAWRESTDHQALSPILKSFYDSSEVRVLDVLASQPETARSA